MNDKNNSFIDWIKYRWKVIQVSDRHFFTFIWTAAILITAITVIISASVIASSGGKKSQKDKKAKKQEVTATATDANIQPVTEATTEKPKTDDWELILVNKDNPLPEGFTVPEFVELRDGQKVDSRIYPSLQEMFDKAREEGVSPYVKASYKDDVSGSDDKKLQELLDSGRTREQAEAELGIKHTGGGTDEHQTGLAIDVASENGDDATKAVVDWMKENSYKYGFIVRFPEDKADITGVTEEDLHLRYVGEEAATKMHESGQCLEEYLGAM